MPALIFHPEAKTEINEARPPIGMKIAGEVSQRLL